MGQQKGNVKFSPTADSGIQSPITSMQPSPESLISRTYENRALFPLPHLDSHILPMTTIPRQPPELPNPICGSQPSNTTPSLTSASD